MLDAVNAFRILFWLSIALMLFIVAFLVVFVLKRDCRTAKAVWIFSFVIYCCLCLYFYEFGELPWSM